MANSNRRNRAISKNFTLYKEHFEFFKFMKEKGHTNQSDIVRALIEICDDDEILDALAVKLGGELIVG